LCGLAQTHLGEQGAALYRSLTTRQFSPQTIASVLETETTRFGPFPELIREQLYRSLIEEARNEGGLAIVLSRNTTLRSVASFCATVKDGIDGYSPNPRVHAVITFNVDSLLQAYGRAFLPNQRGQPLFRTIERPSKHRHSSRMSVYHMHGFIQFRDTAVGNRAQEAPDKVAKLRLKPSSSVFFLLDTLFR